MKKIKKQIEKNNHLRLRKSIRKILQEEDMSFLSKVGNWIDTNEWGDKDHDPRANRHPKLNSLVDAINDAIKEVPHSKMKEFLWGANHNFANGVKIESKKENYKEDLNLKELRQYISQILNENKLSGRTLEGVLNLLDGYASNTWIFFDTETTGLNPRSAQLTEIGAIAVNPNTWVTDADILDQFNEKIKLTPATERMLNDPASAERIAWEKTNNSARRPLKDPQSVLSMTRYGESNGEYGDEQNILDQFFEWAAGFENPLFVAQNASFDLKFLNVRSKGKLPRYPVLDTQQLLEMYLIPLLKTQSQAEEGNIESQALLDKLFVKKGNWGYHSSSMGVVAKAYGINIDDWHNALADVKMMMAMYKNVVNTLQDGISVDVSKEHTKVLNYRKKSKKR